MGAFYSLLECCIQSFRLISSMNNTPAPEATFTHHARSPDTRDIAPGTIVVGYPYDENYVEYYLDGLHDPSHIIGVVEENDRHNRMIVVKRTGTVSLLHDCKHLPRHWKLLDARSRTYAIFPHDD